MGCLLELRHFSGEGANEVVRSVAVVVVTVHLQRKGGGGPGDYSNISQVVSGRNGFNAPTFRGLSRSLEQNVWRGTVNFFQVGLRLFFTTYTQPCLSPSQDHYCVCVHIRTHTCVCVPIRVLECNLNSTRLKWFLRNMGHFTFIHYQFEAFTS